MKEQNDIDVYIGARLKKQRQKLGISQNRIAEELGVSHQLIQKQEAGETRISASMLYQMAKILNLNTDYFFEGYNDVTDNISTLPQKGDIVRSNIKNGWNVLLIEDNPEDEILFRKSIDACFPEYDVNLHVSHNGLEAMQYLRQKGIENREGVIPDIIFLDLNLPQTDGLSLLKEVKQDRDLRFIPIVILTNSVNAEEMLKSYQMFASGYICKSFDINTFRDKLRNVLSYWMTIVITPQNF